MALSAGARLGPYEILSLAGSGGMGEVYRARDTRLDRTVAVKVLPSQFADDPERRQRFEREARAVSALSHPNICTLHDVGSQDGTPYLVMEFVEGEALAGRLKQGPLPLAQVLRYGAQIAEALGQAHRAGVVHRDLKPGNVMVTKAGVKLLDFGLATLRDEPERTPGAEAGIDLSSPTLSRYRTGEATLAGTLPYMAPEQVEGRTADVRTDIWALGAVLYEMASGVAAFAARSHASVIAAILEREPVSIRERVAASPAALDRVVRACLSKDPDERWQSAHDVATALRLLADEGPPGELKTRPEPARGRVKRVALGVVLAAAAGFLLARALPTKEAKSEPARFRQITFRRGNVLHARFAPDGQNVVYSAAWEGKPAELFLTRAEGGESRPLGIASADLLAISSTGEMAILLKKGFLGAATGRGTLARVSLTGGAPREVLEDALQADWSPDGSELAVLRWRSGGWLRLEYPVGRLLHETQSGVGSLRVSPRGDLVAFAEYGERGADVCVVDRQGRKRVLSGNWPGLGELLFMPDGQEILFMAGRSPEDRALRAVTLDGRERILFRNAGRLNPHDVSRDGRLLVELESFRTGVLCRPPGEPQERDLSWLDGTRARDISPDGSTLLLAEVGEAAGPAGAIYVRKTDGSPAVRLGAGTPLSLSRDGRLVLTLAAGDTPELTILPTGAGEPRRVPTADVQPSGGTFLPDGRIGFVGFDRSQRFGIYTVDADGGQQRLLTREPVVGGAVVSPDGRLAAFNVREGHPMIFPESGPPRPVPGLERDDELVQWSQDGGSLYVRRRGELPARVFRLDLATGRKVPWRELMPADASGIVRIDDVVMTRDARAYAYTYARSDSSELFVMEAARP